MDPKCVQCRKPIELAATGRPRRYCSGRCRVVAYRARQRKGKGGLSVPYELTVLPRFVRHVHKRPVTVDGKQSSVTDPATWSSFDDATASKVGDGIGFVLGEGIGCIDLDDCFLPDGSLTVGAQKVLRLAGKTWVEVSPSGRGLHVWGHLPEGPGRVRVFEGQKVETYSRARYMTITGDLWGGTPLQLGPLPTLS